MDDINNSLVSLGEQLNDFIKNNSDFIEEMAAKDKDALGGYTKAIDEMMKDKAKVDSKTIKKTQTYLNKLNFNVESTKKLAELREEGTIFDEWNSKLKNMLVEFTAIISDPRVAGGLFFGAALKESGEFVKNIDESRRSMGVTGDSAITLGKNIGAASAESLLYGASMSDNIEAASALVDTTNDLSDATTENIVAVSKLSSMYGVSVQASAQLLDTFSMLNNNSAQMARSSLDYMTNLAKANNIPLAKMAEGLASNTEFFALYAKNGGKNLIDASATISKMGLEMDDVASITNGLLDYESSIGKEMEANAILGKNINLQRARELASVNDIDGMTREVVKQLGGVGKWNELNIYQKRSLAEALNSNVTSIQTMMSKQSDLNKLTETQTTFWGKSADYMSGLIRSAGQYKEVLLTGVNAAGSLAMIFPNMGKSIGNATGKLGGLTKKLFGISKEGKKGKLSSMFSKLFGGANKQLQKTQALSGELAGGGNSLVGFIKSFGLIGKKDLINFGIVTGILIVSLPLIAIGLKQFNGVDWKSAIIGMGSVFILAQTMKIIGNLSGGILKGAFAFGIMSVALIPFAYALKSMMGIDWKTLTVAGVAILGFTAAIFGLGAILSSGVGAVIFGAGIIGFTALGVAMMSLGAGLGAVTAHISELATVLPQLGLIGAGFSSMAVGLTELAGSLLLISPMIPILGAVSLMSGKLSNITTNANITTSPTQPNGTSTSTSQNTEANAPSSELMSKIDKLIDLLLAGGTVQMDGKQMGKWVAMTLDSFNTYPH